MRSIYVYTDSRDDSMGSLVVILAASSCTVSIFQHVACADLEGGRGGGGSGPPPPEFENLNTFLLYTPPAPRAQRRLHKPFSP